MFGMGKTKSEAYAALNAQRDPVSATLAGGAVMLERIRAAIPVRSYGPVRELISEEVVKRAMPQPGPDYRKPGTRHTHKPVGRQKRFGTTHFNAGKVHVPS